MFLIVLLILIVIILSMVLYIYSKVKTSISKFSQAAFNTSDIVEGFRRQNLEAESRPKSLSGMEPLTIPYINKDFPHLNISEMKAVVEGNILKCLNSIESKQIDKLDYTSNKVINWINSKISDNASYDSIKFHQTIINRYENNNGVCRILFQTSLEYLYKRNGESYRKIQERFNTEYIYIFDDTKVGKYQSGIALNCPNCGAPIKNLGEKVCNYCGTGVIDLVQKTWIFNDISQF